MTALIPRLLLVLCVALVWSPHARSESDQVFGVASAREHAWYLLPSPETAEDGLTWSLAHAGQRDEPNVFRLLRRFQNRPAAITADNDHLWLILAPNSTRPRQVSVRVLRVEWDPRIDRYIPVPRTGLDLLPDLPIAGPGPIRPLGLEATPRGPVALIDEGSDRPRMHRLVRGVWTEVDLPPDVSGSLHLGKAGEEIVLLDTNPEGPRQWRLGTDGWVPEASLPPGSAVMETAAANDQLMAMIRTPEGSRDLAFIQPDGLVRLGSVPAEPENVHMLPLGTAGRTGFAMVDDSALSVMTLDPLTGTASPWTVQKLGSPLSMSLWPVLIAFATSAVVLIVLLRGRLLSVPEGFLPLSPVLRLVALVIDAIPAIVAVTLWRGVEPRLFVEALMLTMDINGWVTYSWIVLMTGGWSLLGEIAVGFSPGKALVGGRIVREGGGRASFGQCLLRTIFKMMMLMLPILAVTALRPPSFQSVADQATRVMVATRSSPKSSR